jgi:hypothetical protein
MCGEVYAEWIRILLCVQEKACTYTYYVGRGSVPSEWIRVGILVCAGKGVHLYYGGGEVYAEWIRVLNLLPSVADPDPEPAPDP